MSAKGVDINGPAIREIRKARGVRSETLAEEVGISREYLFSIEVGRRSSVSPPVFQKLVFSLVLEDSRAILQNPYQDYTWVRVPQIETVSA